MEVQRTNAIPPQRVLIFDTECRPLHYSDWRKEDQITAIAWKWLDSEYVQYGLLESDLSNERLVVESFLYAYHRADIVVGHYIRKHDLPLLSDHALRLDIPMSGCLTQDTMMDIVKVKGLGKSQANLSATFGLKAEKFNMTGADWRKSNMFADTGRTLERVITDVNQNQELYEELKRRNALHAPKRWER